MSLRRCLSLLQPNPTVRRRPPAAERLEGRTLLSADRFDPDFGDGGPVRIDLEGTQEAPWAVATQPDGKLLIAGSALLGPDRDEQGIVIRLNADGSRDASFGEAGVARVAPLADVTAMTLLPDGKILAGGVGQERDALGVTGYDATLVRLNPDGTVDTTFGGGDGAAAVHLGNWTDAFADLAVAPDGKIVGIGTGGAGEPGPDGYDQGDFAIARFTADGAPDATFGGDDGVVVTDFSDAPYTRDQPVALAFAPGGKILVSGSTGDHAGPGHAPPPDGGFAFARYNDDGSPDATFGDGGVLVTRFAPDPDDVVPWAPPLGGGIAGDLLVHDDGSFHALGVANNRDLALARYHADGSLDASFGAGGIATVADVRHRFYLSEGEGGTLVATGVNKALYAATFDTAGTLIDTTTGGGDLPAGEWNFGPLAVGDDGTVVAVGGGTDVPQGELGDREAHDRWSNSHDILVARFERFEPPPPAPEPEVPPGRSPIEPVPDVGHGGGPTDDGDPRELPAAEPTAPAERAPPAVPGVPVTDPGELVDPVLISVRPPDFQVRARRTAVPGRAYTIRVRYDGEFLTREALDDVLVTGPDGYRGSAEVVRIKVNRAGTRAVATYQASGPWTEPGAGGGQPAGEFTATLVPPGAAAAEGVPPVPGGRVLTTFTAGPARRTREVLPAEPGFTAALTEAYAWCDHMPALPADGQGRRHLVVTATLTNTSDVARDVSLERTFLSFEAGQRGQGVRGVSLRDPADGLPTGGRSLTLAPGEARTVQLRGDGVFPEGRHEQRLYAAFVFRSAGGRVTAEASTVVEVTH